MIAARVALSIIRDMTKIDRYGWYYEDFDEHLLKSSKVADEGRARINSRSPGTATPGCQIDEHSTNFLVEKFLTVEHKKKYRCVMNLDEFFGASPDKSLLVVLEQMVANGLLSLGVGGYGLRGNNTESYL